MGYCAHLLETGDEITIQESSCYHDAAPDLKDGVDDCEVKRKYKAKTCELLVKEKSAKSVDSCMKDSKSVSPFVAGD